MVIIIIQNILKYSTEDELTRREMLIEQLRHDQMIIQNAFNNRSSAHSTKYMENNGNHPAKGLGSSLSSMLGLQNQIMRDQDQQLEGISQGVSNLHQYSLAVKDESELHVKLLHDIDTDVHSATMGLENEASRAERVARQNSHGRLYLTILILFIILLFLLIAGG